MPSFSPLSFSPLSDGGAAPGEPGGITAAVAAAGLLAYTGTAAVVATIVSASDLTAAAAATGLVTYTGTAAVVAALVDLAYVPMTAWEEFQPFVGLDLPGGVPPQVLEHHARQACIEFFQKSLAWQRELSMTASAGLARYTIQAPLGAALVKLLEQASIGGRPVSVVSMECARGSAQRGSLDGVWTDDLATLNVAPVPAESGAAILVAAALKPLQSSTGIPSALFEQYAEPISFGILARLLSMKGRAWSNPSKAADMKREFDYAIADAAWAATSGFSRAPVRSKISLM